MTNIRGWTAQYERPLLSLATLVPLLALVLAFLRTDLTSWDMVGHLGSALYFRDHLWPALSGWNAKDGFGGYPEGYFYPPLFEWLVGGLGRLIPIGWAFRGCLGVSVLLLPVSVHTFLKGVGLDRQARFTAVFWMLSALLVASPLALGGFFTATFHGGLVSAGWSLPMVFFYLAALGRAASLQASPARRAQWWVVGSVLLSVLLLAHAFNSMAAVILSAALLPVYSGGAAHVPAKLRAYVAHGVLAAALAAVWLVPYVANHEWSSGRLVLEFPLLLRARRGLWLYVPAIALCLSSVLSRFYGQKRGAPGLLYPLLFILTVYGALQVLGTRNDVHHLPLHPYRLLVFVTSFLALLAGDVLSSFRWRTVTMYLSAAIYISSAIFFIGHYFGVTERAIDATALHVPPASRGLVSENHDSPFERSESPHLLAFDLQQQGLTVLNGVFVESSAVSPYIYGLLRELDKNAYVANVQRVERDPREASFHEWALGIGWILSGSEVARSSLPANVRTEEVPLRFVTNEGGQAAPHFLYRTEFATAELFRSPPALLPEGTPWESFVESWWKSGMAFGSVPVRDADASETFSVPEDSDTTTLTQIGFDHYRLEIVSARPRWVYVRLPYFPTWHALQPTGELRVHEASVHLMAICATGTVELVSRSGRIERVAAIMSATAWATALLTWLAMRRKSVMLAR